MTVLDDRTIIGRISGREGESAAGAARKPCRSGLPGNRDAPERKAMDLIGFTQRMERCWIEQRYEDLAAFVDRDAVYVPPPGGGPRFHGLPKIVDAYRQWLAGIHVRRFQADNFRVVRRGRAAVVEYDWEIEWGKHGSIARETGREVLALCARPHGWRIVWRTTLPPAVPAAAAA